MRTGHWLLVASVAASLLSGFLGGYRLLDAHIAVGIVVAALIVVRLVWGFTGTRHARFADFVRSPAAVLAYARALLGGTAPHHIGHNPLGGAMIVALLAVLALEVITGAVALGGMAKEGPLAPSTSYATGRAAGELHRLAGFVLLGLIALHVAGVLAESARTGERLVRAMIDGRKRAPAAGLSRSQGAPAATARPRLATACCAAVAAASIPLTVHLSLAPALGVPQGPLDPLYAKECGACHSAHHPSAAPAATWRAVMAGLDDHFGESASLGSQAHAEIAAYLARNAAEHYDSAAANRLRTPSAADPLRITATEGWRYIHRGIESRVLQRKAMAGGVNCGNCHGDADSGRFARRAIVIPAESEP